VVVLGTYRCVKLTSQPQRGPNDGHSRCAPVCPRDMQKSPFQQAEIRKGLCLRMTRSVIGFGVQREGRRRTSLFPFFRSRSPLPFFESREVHDELIQPTKPTFTRILHKRQVTILSFPSPLVLYSASLSLSCSCFDEREA